MTERLVVVGGDAGGMTAASQARRLQGPERLEIVAFERGRHTSYSACGIPYFIGDVVPDGNALIIRTPEEFRDRQHITVHVRHEVTEIDLTRRRLRVRDLERDAEFDTGFDHLVVATGSVPLRPRLPGSDASGIYGVQSHEDGVRLRRRLDDGSIRRAVVVGGGYIGVEMAEALVLRGIDVSLVEARPQPMGSLDPDMGVLVADALRGIGVEVVVGEAVVGFDTASGRLCGVATAARTLPADLVVLGLGVRPNAALAAEAGLVIGSTGGVVVDRRMQTSTPGVWAVGDCVESFHRVSRRPVALALGTHANKQGEVAGVNIAGGYATFPGVVGTAILRIGDVEVARTGLGEQEAAASGFEAVAVTSTSTTAAAYCPESAAMRTKLVVEPGTGRLLGAQIVGGPGAAKRIDVLATAVWNEMDVAEISQLDLAYAPPFSPVWDPVLAAARRARGAAQRLPAAS